MMMVAQSAARSDRTVDAIIPFIHGSDHRGNRPLPFAAGIRPNAASYRASGGVSFIARGAATQPSAGLDETLRPSSFSAPRNSPQPTSVPVPKIRASIIAPAF